MMAAIMQAPKWILLLGHPRRTKAPDNSIPRMKARLTGLARFCMSAFLQLLSESYPF